MTPRQTKITWLDYANEFVKICTHKLTVVFDTCESGGFAEDVNHVSTGGGAFLALLSRSELPVLECLTQKEQHNA